MSSTRTVRPQAVAAEIPPVPLTVEGYSVLHQMMRFNWAAWRPLRAAQKTDIVREATSVLAKMEQNSAGQSALFSLLGHKGDLMFVHFRPAFDELNQAELNVARLRLSDYLEPTTSYISVIELGLYESTIKAYSALAERGAGEHRHVRRLGLDRRVQHHRRFRDTGGRRRDVRAAADREWHAARGQGSGLRWTFSG